MERCSLEKPSSLLKLSNVWEPTQDFGMRILRNDHINGSATKDMIGKKIICRQALLKTSKLKLEGLMSTLLFHSLSLLQNC